MQVAARTREPEGRDANRVRPGRVAEELVVQGQCARTELAWELRAGDDIVHGGLEHRLVLGERRVVGDLAGDDPRGDLVDHLVLVQRAGGARGERLPAKNGMAAVERQPADDQRDHARDQQYGTRPPRSPRHRNDHRRP
jgi:hypothetical protein